AHLLGFMQVTHSQVPASINLVSFSLRTQHRSLFIGKRHHDEALARHTLVRKQQSYLHRKLFCSAYPARSLAPLTKEEEYECFADVQDLIALEKKKTELEGKLGRVPSYEEWAAHVGCSDCHLYARVGKARAARRKMIAANLPLVSFVAKEFHGRGLSHQELCQEGAKGLMKSTEKFDISHNTKFSTYSYFWIRERMSAAVQKFQSIWMAGRSLQRKVSFVLRCRDEFCKLSGRNPSMDELSAASNIDKVKIRQAFFAMRPMRTPTENKHKDEYMDMKEIQLLENDSPWRTIWQDELKAEFQMLFHALSPRESQVLRMRYGFYEGKPLSLYQIAGLLKVTHEAVRKTEKSAFKKLRKSATENGLQHYLSWIPN
ncbi:hypothetical protein GOP47_0023793, partial [Adiantum capillus-veneris]